MVKTLLLFIMNTLQLTPYQLSVIVGLLLSDGMLSKRNTGALAPKGGGAPPSGGSTSRCLFLIDPDL